MMPHRKDALTPELSGSLPGRTSAPDTRAPRRAGTVAFVATLALTGALAVIYLLLLERTGISLPATSSTR